MKRVIVFIMFLVVKLISLSMIGNSISKPPTNCATPPPPPVGADGVVAEETVKDEVVTFTLPPSSLADIDILYAPVTVKFAGLKVISF